MKQNPETTLTEIEHVRVWSERPFAEVVRRIEAVTGFFDATQIKDRVAASGSPSAFTDAIEAMAGESGFMRFAAWDHGALLRQLGQPVDAIRFAIGHPLIASRMTRLRIGAGLYAPLSLLVATNEGGGTVLEYDRPSTLFKQFGDAGVTEVARELDEKFAAFVESVAGVNVPAK